VIVAPYNSCSDTGYFFIYSFNPDYVGRGNSIVLYVEGGVPPYQWSVSGSAFTLLSSETTEQWNIITCDPATAVEVTETVTVIDSCGTTVSGSVCACEVDNTVCCSDPSYAFSGSLLGGIYAAGMTYTITVIGGCPPYKWETLPASPSDYEFEHKYTNTPSNVLLVKTADTPFYLRVTDNCGNQVGWDGASAAGVSWILSPEDAAAHGVGGGGASDPCSGESGYTPPTLGPMDEDGDYPFDVFRGDSVDLSVVNGKAPYLFWVGICASFSGGALNLISSGPGFTIQIDDDESCEGYTVEVGVIDVCGNTDLLDILVWDCCGDPAYVAPTNDPFTTPETIAIDSQITVAVTGGCGPFEWTVSGTGFSMAMDQTEGGSNTLIASPSACGAATITVTDNCSNSVNIEIRCTTGHWNVICNFHQVGFWNDAPCPKTWPTSVITGAWNIGPWDYMWARYISWPTNYWDPPCAEHSPGDPITFLMDTYPPDYFCVPNQYAYHHWECP
jgi:hypothetical protein